MLKEAAAAGVLVAGWRLVDGGLETARAPHLVLEARTSTRLLVVERRNDDGEFAPTPVGLAAPLSARLEDVRRGAGRHTGVPPAGDRLPDDLRQALWQAARGVPDDADPIDDLMLYAIGLTVPLVEPAAVSDVLWEMLYGFRDLESPDALTY